MAWLFRPGAAERGIWLVATLAHEGGITTMADMLFRGPASPAHLHRIEGDLANAGYWYRRANRAMTDGNLEQEWKALVAHFLEEKE